MRTKLFVGQEHSRCCAISRVIEREPSIDSSKRGSLMRMQLQENENEKKYSGWGFKRRVVFFLYQNCDNR